MTHLWNPSGFPDIFYDEGVYMRRAMHFLESLNPQEGSFYDHPYFGQILLAGFLGATGYPGSLNPSPTSQSIEALYTIPRILMGILAVVDTFLIYKISENRYSRRVAFISSILFAVMPITWLTRRILLDSMLLPFLLASIYFATCVDKTSGKKSILLVLLSGFFLGTALFTKLPVFTMIPLVGYLVYSSTASKRRMLGAWFIPLILVPMIWPAYSAYLGEIGFWERDVLWQTLRQNAGIASILTTFFLYDPVLMLLGIAGFIYAGITRDLFLLLWIIPFSFFLAAIGYVQYFYWIPVLPVFCIAAAKLIDKTIEINRKLALAAIASVVVFGFISCTLLIITNVTSAQFEAAAFVAGHLDDKTTTASSPVYSWIFIYVFDNSHSLTDYRDLLFYPVETQNMLLVSDQHFQYNIGSGKPLQDAYDKSKSIAEFDGNVFHYDLSLYPYTNMAANYEGSRIEIRSN